MTSLAGRRKSGEDIARVYREVGHCLARGSDEERRLVPGRFVDGTHVGIARVRTGSITSAVATRLGQNQI